MSFLTIGITIITVIFILSYNMNIWDSLKTIFTKGITATERFTAEGVNTLARIINPENTPNLFNKENVFYPTVKLYADMYGVPPDLATAIFGLESNFNPNSYRYEPHIKDASYGIAQVLYRTAQDSGFKGEVKELFEPAKSIKYGMIYLKGLKDKYGTNLSDIIASYNMGFPRKKENTTQIIINTYGKPQKNWVYANQPYIDQIMAYMMFYKKKFVEGNYAEASKILKLIKDKKTQDIIKTYSPALLLVPLVFFMLKGD